jgi:hypothetical protein
MTSRRNQAVVDSGCILLCMRGAALQQLQATVHEAEG